MRISLDWIQEGINNGTGDTHVTVAKTIVERNLDLMKTLDDAWNG